MKDALTDRQEQLRVSSKTRRHINDMAPDVHGPADELEQYPMRGISMRVSGNARRLKLSTDLRNSLPEGLHGSAFSGLRLGLFQKANSATDVPNATNIGVPGASGICLAHDFGRPVTKVSHMLSTMMLQKFIDFLSGPRVVHRHGDGDIALL